MFSWLRMIERWDKLPCRGGEVPLYGREVLVSRMDPSGGGGL